MTPQERAKFDQDLSTFKDSIPAVWRAVYTGCLSKGFSKPEAFALLTAYILSTGTNTIRPDNQQGPGPDPMVGEDD